MNKGLLRSRLSILVGAMTKGELAKLDKEVLSNDVRDYYGHNFTKSEVLGHVRSALESLTDREVESYYNKVVNTLRVARVLSIL